MKIKKHSFKFKLAFSYVFIILISFGFTAFFLDKKLEENALGNIKASLVNQAILIENQIPPESFKKEDTNFLDSLVKTLSSRIKCRITIVNNDGKVLADSEKGRNGIIEMENHAGRPEIRAALYGSTGAEIRYSNTLKIDMLYIALPVKDNQDSIGALRLALPLSDLKEMLSAIKKAVLFSLIFALGLAFVLGSLLTAEIIKPINKMIHASYKFSKGDFSHKIFLDSRDELGELASTLNIMAQNLEDKIGEIEIKNQHLVAILESMVEGIVVVDRESRIISINSSIEKIFDIPKKNLEGKVFLEAIRNNDISDVIDKVLKKGEFASSEIRLILPVQRIFRINASPVFEKGIVAGCLLVIHDMTEIRRLETMRRDFVANVSHELKTPLTSIKGFIETLLEGAVDDKENNRKFLGIIQDHAERLNKLVDDLLSLSCLESNEIILEKKNFDLREKAGQVVMIFASQLREKGVSVRNELPQGMRVNADPGKMEEVFMNLIDNAIKFNKKDGMIKIHGIEEKDRFKVFVEDSGIGIPERDIPRIFERFYRVDKARSRELGGTGLGLSIVKHIVELHGGNTGLESTEGLGSKFWFTLPKQ